MKPVLILFLSLFLSSCATIEKLAGMDYSTEAEYIAALTDEVNATSLPDAVKADLIADLSPLWAEYSDAVADWYDLREALRAEVRARILARK